MIVFPDWYKGGWPDREVVCQDAVRPFTDVLDVYRLAPGGGQEQVLNADDSPRRPFLCSWLPDDYPAKLPVVRFYRGGGATDLGKLRDPASVQVGVIASTRDDSWEILDYIRQVMLALPRAGGMVRRRDGSWTLVSGVGELVGPEMIPELNPDDRLVVHTLAVDCRLPRDVPDYGPIVADVMNA